MSCTPQQRVLRIFKASGGGVRAKDVSVFVAVIEILKIRALIKDSFFAR